MHLIQYELTEKLYENANFIIYRGKNKSDSLQKVLKILNKNTSSVDFFLKFQQEYELYKEFNHPKIVKSLSFEETSDYLILVMEDFGAISLKQYLLKNRLGIQDAILIILSVVDALEEIHAHDVIHKDIKPSNILIHPETKEVKLTDFSIASRLLREEQHSISSNLLEGTILYISPEQTGRMNRYVDYRTDYYSLGVVLYELLAGKVPFDFNDPLELVHAHIAKEPIALNLFYPLPTIFEGKEDVAKILSNITLKLLAKTAEERYQSAKGIKADLEYVLKIVSEGTKDNAYNFQPGQKDISEKFIIPQKLYGREIEIQKLEEGFQKTLSGISNLFLVKGFSGIGKSSLINEIQKSILQTKSYFISGKFDQYKKDIPYSAITQAFHNLILKLLTESNAQIEKWKESLLKAFHGNGQILVDILPELEIIIGKQMPVMELGVAEAQNRFNLMFEEFIKVFATQEHPLVIFIDDLQWADYASLKLIQFLLSDPNIQYLFFIGSYRDNEVDGLHPLNSVIEEIQKSGKTVDSILLKNLSLTTINKMLADILKMGEESISSLSEFVYSRTEGNPFFTGEFLKSLYEDKLINFSASTENWIWDIEKIQSCKMPDNVIEFMIKKITQLPEKTKNILSYASCLGNQFELKVLELILKEECSKTLLPAIKEGMVVSIGGGSFRFQHDRVREAVYSLMENIEKEKTHLKIGKILLPSMNLSIENWSEFESKYEDKIFEIVEHLNFGRNLITEKNEKINLVELNFKAGKKAKLSTAYESGLKLLRTAVHILESIGEPTKYENQITSFWKSHYELALSLYTELSELEYLNTNFEESENAYNTIQQNSKKLMDKIPAVHIQLRQKANLGKGKEAFELGFKILNELGIQLPNPSNKDAIQTAFIEQFQKFNQLLVGKEISELYELPEIQDPKRKQIISIIANLGDIAIVFMPDLLGLMSVLGVVFSMEYGNTKESSISYVMLGVIENIAFMNYRRGYELGQLGLKLAKYRFPDEKIYAKSLAFYGWNVNHWIKHCKEDIDIATEGYELAMKNNDIVYAGYHILMFGQTAFFSSMPLYQVIEYCKKSIAFAIKYKYDLASSIAKPTLQFSLALQGKTDSITSFNSSDFEEEDFLLNNPNPGQGVAYFYMRKFQLYYMYGELNKCMEVLPLLEKSFYAIPRHIVFSEFHFFNALVLASRLYTFSKDDRKKYLFQLETSYNLLKQWEVLCKENFEHKRFLIKAEMGRINHKLQEAMDFYEQSIESAKQYGFTYNEALANELYAIFWLELHKKKIARIYLKEAYNLYVGWGAIAKAKQLEDDYPELIKSNIQKANIEHTLASNKELTTSSTIDIQTILKGTTAISEEMRLNVLLEKIMKILIENAGAQRGALLIKKEEQFYIESYLNGETNFQSIKEKAILLEKTNLLPLSVLNFVRRTKQSVVLDNAAEDQKYNSDIYVKENLVKSILCCPILYKGNLTGIIYLENNLVTGAFTKERLHIINMLSSQAAISLENAILYESLGEKEKQFRTLIENVNVGVFRSTGSGKLLQINPAIVKIFGYDSSQEFLNVNIPDLYESPEERKLFIMQIQADGFCKNFEFRMKRKNGTSFWASITATANYDENRNLVWIDGILEDITERKDFEEQRQKFIEELFDLNHAYQKFVPAQFLHLLQKDKITEVELGDQTQKEIAVLFSDIRSFTTLSESMTPQENFNFLNAYLKRMSPVISSNKGFIDKYIGDAIMALFFTPEHSLNAAIQMQKEIQIYNFNRQKKGYSPISIGIGIHYGLLTLGIIGGSDRMEGTVISDVVNLASRLEGLTKFYGASIIISEDSLLKINDRHNYKYRFLDQVKVKGKNKSVVVYEVLDGLPEEKIEKYMSTREIFEGGIAVYLTKNFQDSIDIFQMAVDGNPEDKAAKVYLERAKYYSVHGVPPDWEGIETMDSK